VGIGAKEVADRLMHAIAEWSVGTEQFDDTTVVVMDVARFVALASIGGVRQGGLETHSA
jgi:hypothetical protein